MKPPEMTPDEERTRELDRARRFRLKAAELPAVSDNLTHASARRIFLDLAGTYETLAQNAEARADKIAGQDR